MQNPPTAEEPAVRQEDLLRNLDELEDKVKKGELWVSHNDTGVAGSATASSYRAEYHSPPDPDPTPRTTTPRQGNRKEVEEKLTGGLIALIVVVCVGVFVTFIVVVVMVSLVLKVAYFGSSLCKIQI